MSLIEDFEKEFPVGSGFPVTPRPTNESLEHIAQALNLPGLPSLLVQLARESRSFGRWFGSLGPDYTSNIHVLGLNAYWKKEGLPDSLFLMTYGFDAVCDCLDIPSADDPNLMRVVQVQVGCGSPDTCDIFAPTFEGYLAKLTRIFREDREQQVMSRKSS